jgi:hypothetical protein
LDLLTLSLPIAVVAFLAALGFSRLGRRVQDQVWHRPWGAAANAARAQASVAPSTVVIPRQGRPARAVLALSWFEGRRLLVHPVLLAILVFNLLYSIAWIPDAIEHERSVLLGVAFFAWSFFLGVGLLIAANLAALRSRRDRTEELYRSLPMTPARRTMGHLVSASPAAVTIGLALLGLAAWLSVAGHEIEIDEGRLLTGIDLVDLAVYVGVLVALGVMLARWVRHPAAGPVAVIGLFVLSGTVTSPESNLDSLAPWVLPVGGSGWHLLYLTGVVVLLGSIAVLKHDEQTVGSWLGSARARWWPDGIHRPLHDGLPAACRRPEPPFPKGRQGKWSDCTGWHRGP